MAKRATTRGRRLVHEFVPVFAEGERRTMAINQEEGPAPTKEAAIARFRGALDAAAGDGFITKAVGTMPKRLQDVIKAKGGPTKW